MASKYSVKFYCPNTFYHIYNRGVEKRTIFNDFQDYSVFLSYLQTYLEPKDEIALQQILRSQNSSSTDKNKALKMLHLKNYHKEIELVCYALLPNHFHLLVKQNTNTLDAFMNSIGTRYAMYFNKRNKRKGVLFQDVYKAVMIESDEQLLQLSRYIHQNPLKWLNIPLSKWGDIMLPFSLPEYMQVRKTSWIKHSYISDFFSKTSSSTDYLRFLNEEDNSVIEKLTIDSETDS